jgi:hypothetical protein
MNKSIRSIMLAAALVTGASAAIAAPRVPDQSDQYGGYHPNSTEGQRAFWANQTANDGD